LPVDRNDIFKVPLETKSRNHKISPCHFSFYYYSLAFLFHMGSPGVAIDCFSPGRRVFRLDCVETFQISFKALRQWLLTRRKNVHSNFNFTLSKIAQISCENAFTNANNRFADKDY